MSFLSYAISPYTSCMSQDFDDIATNHTANTCFNTILARRNFLKASALGSLAFVTGCKSQFFSKEASYEAIKPVQILLAWGDALHPNMEVFDPVALTADQQMQRFGYNCDFTAYFPISKSRGLICVNHEFPDRHLMHPSNKNRAIAAAVEMASVGLSVVEIEQVNDQWQPVLNSKYNRRLSCHNSFYEFSGAAAGHQRLQTGGDTNGTHVTGMAGNCAGGVTPWGTLLTCEENFDFLFVGDYPINEQRNYKRYNVAHVKSNDWGRHDDRFNLQINPNEANKYGWVVEVDPFKPEGTPIKHTALGRFKHEAACCVEASDGRVVVYSGDDQHFEYFYRYVSNRPWRESIEQGKSPLADGVLYIAKFLADGTIDWRPLIHGRHGLTAENGFYSQADIYIETRLAADLAGATPMDRPEGITLNPKNGQVYFACTKNQKRTKVNAANPRPDNAFGHIITITSKDHAAPKGNWEMFVLGDDRRINIAALPCPDNIMAAPNGDLYVTTDGAEDAINIPEGLYKMKEKQAIRLYAAPQGAEITGPSFTPNNKYCFFAVQHPAQGSKFDNPTHRWPDEKSTLPPRPSVVVMKI